MNFAPEMPEPNATRLATSPPRISDPKIMTRFCSLRSVSRSAIHASLLVAPPASASTAESLPDKKLATLPSAPAGICTKLVACRRSLIDCELTTYSFARCRRTLFRICHASSGCCSVGSFPISRIAGAVKTSAMLAVASGLPRSAAEGQGSPPSDDDRRCSSSTPRAQISRADTLLR